MISAYCRKLEKYSCTQMSLRSGYELHLCHNQIFSTPVRFHFLQHFSPHHMQKHKLQSSSRPVPIISGNTQTCASHISPKMSFSLIFSSDSQITPSLQHHTQKTLQRVSRQCFYKYFQVSSNICDIIFLNDNLSFSCEKAITFTPSSTYILSKLSQGNNSLKIGASPFYFISLQSEVYGLLSFLHS